MTRRRLLNIATVLSLVLFVGMVIVWAVNEDDTRPRRSHVVVGSIRCELVYGWIAVFNQSEPFFNGTVRMSGTRNPHPRWPEEVSLRFPGFHFRHFTWPGVFPGGTHWTFALWPGYLAALAAILPAAWGMRRLTPRDGSKGNLCGECSYNLTGNTSGVCPECGTNLPTGGTVTS